MYEKDYKQNIMVGLLPVEGLDDTLPVEESGLRPIEEDSEENSTDISGGDSSSDDVSAGDVGSYDVSSGDVSNGDVLADDISSAQILCTCMKRTMLWESDISNYDTTDGLLLLILIFTIVNTAWNVIGRR